MKVKFKEKGAGLVEFALASVIFFTILFSIIEFGYLFLGNLSMQHAVREGSRYAVVTGTSGFAAPTQQDLRTQAQKRCDAVIKYTEDNSMGFYAKVSPVVTFKIMDDVTGNIVDIGSDPSICGAAEKIVVIHIDCTLPLITPFTQLLSLLGGSIFTDGKYKFSVSTTMRNEAFN
jgi:Flp pilus assembly protein TadG